MDSYHSPQLDALGDATRRAILGRLAREGPLAVGELARDFPMSRPAISQHLRVLKHAKLVTDRPEGTRRVYAVNPEAIAMLRAYFERFWMEALASFKRRVEHEAGKAPRVELRTTMSRSKRRDHVDRKG